MATESELISKIRKLLELASVDRNPSQHEAESAMAKVHELLAKHELELADLKEKPAEDDFCYRFVGQPYRRASSSQRFIGRLLEEHFHVTLLRCPILLSPNEVPTYTKYVSHNIRQSVELPQYAGLTSSERKWMRVVRLLGRKTNILVAEYVYDYLSGEFERQWKIYQKETGKSVSARFDFLAGLYRGLDERLTSDAKHLHRTMTPTQREGLVKRDDKAALDAYVNQECPNVRSVRSAYRDTGDDSALQDGQQVGRNINIRPAVNQSSGQKVLLPAN